MSGLNISVLGAGPVGLCAALGLAKQGHRVSLCRRSLPAQDSRAIALSESSRRILLGLGVWPLIEPQASAIGRIEISQRGYWGKVLIDSQEHGLSAFGFVVPLGHLVNALEVALAQRDVPVISLPANSSDQAVLALPALAQADAQLLTDGSPARWASALGLSVSEHDFQQVALVADVRFSQPHGGQAFERFTEQGPLALLPREAHQCNLVYCQPASRQPQLAQLSEAALLSELQQLFGWRLGKAEALVGPRHVFALKRASLSSAHQGGRVLLGSAARQLHPVSGQGLNLALRDVAAWLALCEGKSALDPADFSAYTQARAADQRRVLASTSCLAELFLGHSALLGHWRSLGLLGVDTLPFLRAWVARQGMGLGAGLVYPD